MNSGLAVTVDGRPLDLESLRSQGIGRYAHGLLGELPAVAEERGGSLRVLRLRGGEGSPFAGAAPADLRPLRRGPLPLDLFARGGGQVHHALSLYGTPLSSRPALVVTMHDVAPLERPDLYMRTGLLHRVLYRAAARAAAVICPSSVARDDVVRHLGVEAARVHVVPEGVDERFRPTEAPAAADTPYLLYVGGLVTRDPRKDVEGLIDAFAAWSRSEGRGETLVLAGATGPATRELEQRARNAGARVVFAGFVDDTDLPALYSRASALVTASRYEGFGLPALEAAACGTPVVAYDTGAVPETAGPAALLAPLGDAAALMSNAGRVCDDPELAARLSARGREHAAAFTWRRTAELTWDVYERVAA